VIARVGYQAITSEDCNRLRRVTIVSERKVREVELLKLVRKMNSMVNLSAPRWQMSQYQDSGSTGHRSQHHWNLNVMPS
jgi:hypothetical protein